MAVYLSAVAGAAWQFFTDSGLPLSGGKLYTYAAGTTTPQATYTSSSGLVANANPIVLNSAGRLAGEVWLTTSVSYKFVLKTSADVVIGTYDDIIGLNDFSSASIYAALASTADNTKGDALIGFKQSNSSGFLTGATARTVNTKLQDVVSVKDFGATGDGVTNDRAAFLASNIVTEVYVPPGTYLISTSLTLTAGIRFAPGAMLLIPNGVVVTFSGAVDALPYQIFSFTGTGSVVISTLTPVGYAEWFGAVTGSSGAAAANTTAINSAIVALSKVQLLAADYYTNARLLMATPYRELAGMGERYGSVANAMTRIICTSASADIIQVGPDTYPGSVNALQQGNKLTDLYVVRSVAPDVITRGSGVKNIYTLYALFRNVESAESAYCWQFYGTVQTQAYRCWAFRSVAGTGGTDVCYGYYVNGFASIGLNSGNASIYLNYCNATMGSISITGSSGFYLDNNFTDAFLESPESSAFAIGINVQGNANNVTLNAGNTDLQIKHPILDTFTYAGIFATACNKYGSIEVIGGYYGPASGATACAFISASVGVVHFVGGQMVMQAAASTNGFSVNSSNNVTIDRTIILDCRAVGVDFDTVTNCDFRPIVTNYGYTLATAVVRGLNTCSRNIIGAKATGAASSLTLGVQLVGAGHSYTEVNCSGLDATAIVGGSANKLLINAVQITATGLTGTNLASGIMA